MITPVHEYYPFITVIRSRDRFQCAVMKWDQRLECYTLDFAYHHRYKTKTDAAINAEALAGKLGLSYREGAA